MCLRPSRSTLTIVSFLLTGLVGGDAAWGQLDLNASQILDLTTPGVPGEPAAGDGFGERVVLADFDGDGDLDLALSLPKADRDLADVGAVMVFWGDGAGGFAGEEVLEHGLGLPGTREAADRFGSGRLVAGDFDADGFADLAVGSSFDDVDGLENSGSVMVVPGGVGGFDRARAMLIARQPELLLPVEAGDFVGTPATGDFDGDGFDDLAVGMINRVDGIWAAGSVQVLYGSEEGLAFDRIQLWHQGLPGIPGELEENDRFGTSLAAGDFDGDGRDDLAIGAPRDQVAGLDTGSVTVLRGSANGLTAAGARMWTKGADGIAGKPADFDLFGQALAAGDVQGDGYDELAISDVHEQIDGLDNVGAVWVLAGGVDGLEAWHRLAPGTSPVAAEVLEEAGFGAQLRFGDFNADGRGDLVIAPLFGAVGPTVLYGAPGGFAATSTQTIVGGLPGFPAVSPGGDLGRGLATGDLDGVGGEELVLGVPDAVVDGASFAGSVRVFNAPAATSCAVAADTHCLQGGRFRAKVRQRVAGGAWTPSRVVGAVADDSGLFTFYNPRNWELMLKVLDGCAVNGRFWTYLAATTNLEHEVRLTDTWTGATKVYASPKGPAAARADTKAFVCGATLPDGFAPAVTPAVVSGLSSLACAVDGGALCLQGQRFRATVDWWTADGTTGSGEVVPLGTDLSGLFWFFRADNWELLVKVLDGCAVNGHHWVFGAAVTNVGYRLRVVDERSGEEREYVNPLGTLSPAIIDTEAFAGCS